VKVFRSEGIDRFVSQLREDLKEYRHVAASRILKDLGKKLGVEFASGSRLNEFFKVTGGVRVNILVEPGARFEVYVNGVYQDILGNLTDAFCVLKGLDRTCSFDNMVIDWVFLRGGSLRELVDWFQNRIDFLVDVVREAVVSGRKKEEDYHGTSVFTDLTDYRFSKRLEGK
jgi:hypothetical protein